MDNSSEIFSTGGAGGTLFAAQNPLNYKWGEYGLSGLDFPNNWVLSFVEEIPFYRSQHGFVGHVLGGWAVSGVYTLSSGQPCTPVQSYANCYSLGGACGFLPPADNPYDAGFNTAFVGDDGAVRPFIANPGAPASAVGIYAGDACTIAENFGLAGGTEPVCKMSPTTLISFNNLNSESVFGQGSTALANYNPAVVGKGDVRFITNGAVADQVYDSPYGTARRNVLRDYDTNTINLGLFKTTNITERMKLQFHADMVDAFNHPNFASIDPFIEDAGYVSEFTGFANPLVQAGGARSIRFGLKLVF